MFRCLKRGPGFYVYLWRLTGPIALQNLITFSLGLIDTLMVSWLGNTQMAAVTTANVPVFLLISIVFGVQSGLGILVSQYWGKKDMESISRAIGVAAMLGTGITLVLNAKVPGIDQATFERIANAAKAGCVISRALSVPVELKATLES